MARRSALWPDPRVKPPFGAAEIDWGHSLARGISAAWLFTEGAGQASPDFSPFQWTTAWTGTTWGTTALGLAVAFTGSDEIIIPAGVTAQVFSVAARFLVTGTTGYRGLLGETSSAASQELRVNNSSNTVSLMKQNTAQIGVTSGSVVANVVTDLVVTYDAAGNLTFYLQGVLDSTSLNLLTFGATTEPCLGNSADGVLTGSIVHFYYYQNKILTAADALQLSAEPYAFLRPIIRRRYFAVAAAGGGIPTLVGDRFSLAGPRGLAG